MTLSLDDAHKQLQKHLNQENYHLATTLLSNRLLHHGYVATVELFRAVGGFEQAMGIWQACLSAIQGTPEGEIVHNVIDSPHGYHLLSSHASPGMNVTYTVGLWHHFWHPEIICVGLPAPVARLLLMLYGERVAHGCPPPLNEPISGGAIANSQVQFKVCSDAAKAEFLPRAVWFNGTQDFGAIQMIWQDPHQRWPWEDGFSAAEPQRLLLH